MGRGGGMLDRMATELKLTPDQKSKIQAIFTDQRTKMEKLRADTDTKVKKVLTPAQQKQYAQMQAQMRQRFGGPGGPGGPGGRRP
jgi:Spy/CpxP family protein refolding chaperone